ncbi:MAG TPA: hypothetical protein VIO61_10655 [Anaerolineaceae bacterium]
MMIYRAPKKRIRFITTVLCVLISLVSGCLSPGMTEKTASTSIPNVQTQVAEIVLSTQTAMAGRQLPIQTIVTSTRVTTPEPSPTPQPSIPITVTNSRFPTLALPIRSITPNLTLIPLLTLTTLPTQSTPKPSPTIHIPVVSYQLTVNRSVVYCEKQPTHVKFSITMEDITKGVSLYYRVRDKKTNYFTDWEIADFQIESDTVQSVTLIAGGDGKNIHYYANMGESWLEYQVIADDGSYRSPLRWDIDIFPCESG